MIRRRVFLAGASSLLATPALIGRASADNPAIRLVVGGPAGSAVDQGARSFTPFLERHLPGARIEVVNAPGEVGLTALRVVGSAAPDGRTLGWVSTPALPARFVDHPGMEQLLEGLTLVGAVEREPIAVVTQVDGPFGSIQDLIARSSENASSVPLGTPPTGSAPHLATLKLQAMSGTSLNIVAFPSAAAARQAALAGNVAAAFLPLGAVVEYLRAGELTGLGIAGHRRVGAFPDLTPLHDAGFLTSSVIQRGIAIPGGCAAETVMRIAVALQAVVVDPEFTAQGRDSGFKPIWLTGDDWSAQIVGERASLARLWSTEPWFAVGLG